MVAFAIVLLFSGLSAPSQTVGSKNFASRLDGILDSWLVKQSYRWQGKSPPVGNPTYQAPRLSLADYQSRLDSLDSRFPMFCDEEVKAFIELMTREKRRSAEVLLGLGDAYFPELEAELVRRGLPDELKYVPVALSALNAKESDPGRGAGLWRMGYHQGLRYGLSVSAHRDERLLYNLCTRAAIRYLEDLYLLYEDWWLTLIAFQSSPGVVNVALEKAGGKRDVQSVYPHLPGPDREFIPAFIAGIYLFSYAAEHDLHPVLMNLSYPVDTVAVNKSLHFGAISELMGISEDELAALNPVLSRRQIPAGELPEFYLPEGRGAEFERLRDTLESHSDSLLLVRPPGPCPLPFIHLQAPKP